MFQHTFAFIQAAEKLAAGGAPIEQVLPLLRRLGLDDFGLLLLSMPNPEYPSLSEILPKMASDAVQDSWTGSHGGTLLLQTATFVRLMESVFARHRARTLAGARMLDFGCGYGRMIRMLYYFSDPQDIWGVDAWDESLKHCRDSGLLGNLGLSDAVPSDLPVGDAQFDLVYAFSIFTHLRPNVMTACLAAIRKHMAPGGLFLATYRPVEFWSYIDGVRGTQNAERLLQDQLTNGYAYLPHGGAQGETYGDVSVDLTFFEQPGWRVLGYDSSLVDAYQICAILAAD